MRHPSASRTRRTNEVPPINTGVTLCEKTKRFVRFLPSKHQLHETSKQPFQCKMQSWITKQYGTAHGSCKDHLRVALTMGATFAPSERKRIEPHPSHKRGSPQVSCDFYPPSMPSTKRPSISHISTLSLHISALLYSLHISTLSTSLLSPYLCSLHISTLSTSLLFPHPYSLDISNLFTPLTRHLSTLFTPLISSHPYSLHSSNLFTSVLASLL